MSSPIPIKRIKSVKSVPELSILVESESDSGSDVELDSLVFPDVEKSIASKDPMCFSVFVDNKKDMIGMPPTRRDSLDHIIPKLGCTPPEKDYISTNLNNIYPKETKKWVDSNLVLSCQNCSTKFGMFTRKHHCRACGGVFCSTCCYQYASIPEKYIQKPKEDDSYKQKISNTAKWIIKGQTSLVCKECFVKINNLKKITHLIKICKFLDLTTLHSILKISKNWHNAGIHQLSKFREIQYVDPNVLYNKWQLNFLKEASHKKFLVGHNAWLICLTKSVVQSHYSIQDPQLISYLTESVYNCKKNKLCWDLMCSRKCNVSLDIADFIEILKFVSVMETKTKLGLIWNDSELQFLILFLLKKMYSNTSDVHEVIIKCIIPLICSVFSLLMNVEPKKINYGFLTSLFNEISKFKNVLTYFIGEIDYLSKQEFRTLGATNFAIFMQKYISEALEYNFSAEIEEMSKGLIDLHSNEKTLVKLPILYPLDFSYKITKIIGVERLKSYTKPLLLTVCITNSKKIEKIVKIIIKKDSSLRKERIVSCVITLLQYKLYQQALRKRLDMFEQIPTYQIVMISKDIGVIQYVENSVTLQKINDMGLSLQNYVLEKNPGDKIENTKRRFLQSLAISSSLSYILGLGDRHLGNVMMNDAGQLFNIDYGYLLDNPMTSILSAPNIKVTGAMIDFLGGPSGLYYKEFKDYVTKVYDVMRLYKNIIINYYEMINHEHFIVDWKSFREKLEARFMNGMNCRDLEVTLINEIESSNSYSGALSDLCHHYKEKITGIFN